jgi:hypothetical protein
MQVGPMGGDVEPAGFGTDQGVFVGLRRRQGGGGIQLGQFIFEHAFNIWIAADTPQRLGVSQSNGQHQIDSDNTAIQRRRHGPASGARNQKLIALRPTDIERFAAQCHEN